MNKNRAYGKINKERDVEHSQTPNGVFRTNKIILTNPRKVTDEMAMEFYLKSTIPEKSYYKAMAGCAVRGHINTAKKIIEDKVNKENLDENTKIIYNILLNIKKTNRYKR